MPDHPGLKIMIGLKKKPGEEGPPGPEAPPAGPPMPEEDPLRIAAQDLIDSVQAGDVDGVMAALQSAFETCSMPMPEEGGED